MKDPELKAASRLAPYLWLAALAVIPYLQSLPNEFTLDDAPIIVSNPLAHSLRHTAKIFSSSYWADAGTDNYRPLPVWTYALQYSLHGGTPQPWEFRIVNLCLYAICGGLIYFLIKKMFDQSRLALMTTMLFLVHPIHVEVVASIIGRADLMMLMFLLLSLIYYLRSAEAGSQRDLGISLTCGFLALLCKENAISWLALIPLVDVVRWGRSQKHFALWERLRTRGRVYLALLAVVAIYFCIRIAVLGVPISSAESESGSYARLEGAPRLTQWATASRSLGHYWTLLVWPVKLASHHEISFADSFQPWDTQWPLFAALAVLATMGACIWKRSLLVPFAIGWFAVTFFPVSNFLIPIGELVAERLMFMPSLGVALAVAWGISLCGRRWQIGPLIVLVWLGLVRSGPRIQDWQSNLSLFSAAADTYPDSGFIMNQLGVAYVQTHQLDRAELMFLRAIQKMPYNASPYLHLGAVLQERGAYEAADLYYAQAAALDPESPLAPFNRGLVAVKRNRPDEAILHYQATLKINPNFAPAFNAIGAVRARQGNWDAAEIAFRRAVALDPTDKIAQDNLQNLLQERIQRSPSHP